MPRSSVLGRRFEAFTDVPARPGRYNDALEAAREARRPPDDGERLRGEPVDRGRRGSHRAKADGGVVFDALEPRTGGRNEQ
jgi:hypothetical protein